MEIAKYSLSLYMFLDFGVRMLGEIFWGLSFSKSIKVISNKQKHKKAKSYRTVNWINKIKGIGSE